MTSKQKAFVTELVTNPKTSGTQAAIKAGYSPKTAAVIASENLKKPQIMAYLTKFSDKAEQGLMETVEASKKFALQGGRDGAAYASTAVSGYNSILDRVHGKATQKIESKSTSVVIGIDLSGSTEDDAV